jgi:hypothetical protein
MYKHNLVHEHPRSHIHNLNVRSHPHSHLRNHIHSHPRRLQHPIHYSTIVFLHLSIVIFDVQMSVRIRFYSSQR